MKNLKYKAQLQWEIMNNPDMEAEVIIKYSGNLTQQIEAIGGVVEYLSESYGIVTILLRNMPLLAQIEMIEYIEGSKDMFFMERNPLSQSCIYNEDNYITAGLRGQGVFIGVIDSGINAIGFTDLYGNSRIKYVWDLSVLGTPPEGFYIGKELTREEISTLNNDFIGHGTAVTGIACGNNIGVATESEIIVVKLNNRNGFARSTEIMRGLKYISDKAIENNKPVVINISYGTNDGPHDGRTLFEEYINFVADRWKTSVVVAVGNEGNTSHHFRGQLENNELVSVDFNIAENTSSVYLSMWKSFVDKVNIRLIAPDGQEGPIMNETGENYFFVLDNANINVIFGQPTPYTTGEEIYFSVRGDFIQSGVWQIAITGEDIVEGIVDIWLPVNENQGRNTIFLMPDPDITLTIPSTASRVISVGGYNAEVNSIGFFSGRGYTRLYNQVKPDLVAPGYNIRTFSNNGGYTTVTGTSFSAPFVTGAVALLMEWGIVKGNDPYLYGERIKAYLQASALREQNRDYPNRQWGYGRLCVENAFRMLNNLRDLSLMELSSSTEKIYSNDFVDLVLENNGEGIYNSTDVFVETIDNRYVIAHINRNVIGKYIGDNINSVLGFEPFLMGMTQLSALENSGILQVQTQPNLALRGRGVLVAVIDTGIDYRNSEFIYEDNTTKIVSIWDQELMGIPPQGQYYGMEFTEEDINNALSNNQLLPTTDIVGHGTRLAAIAGGRSGAAPDCRLIIVKLKQAKEYLRQTQLLDENVMAFQSSDVMTAINYVYQKAQQLNMPVSVCLGVGTTQGGHTGNSIIERYISDVATRTGVCISVPMGNEALSRHHSTVDLTEGTAFEEVEISVGENERGFPVWIWSFITDSISVEIISPLGNVITRILPQANFRNEYYMVLEGTRIFIMYIRPLTYSEDQLAVIRFEQPLSGIWRIRLYGERLVRGTVHLWMPISGFVGENSIFLMPSVETTLTTPANSINALSVGAWNENTNSAYPQSGRGPTRINIIKPTILAPGVNVLQGSGTSIATAVVCGGAALLLEWGIVKENNVNMNTKTVTSYLIEGAEKNMNVVYPNNIYGYGILNLLASFRNIL